MVKKNDKKDLAEALYMSGINQQDIAEKIGVSRVTVNKWCMSGGWKERRGAKKITSGSPGCQAHAVHAGGSRTVH